MFCVNLIKSISSGSWKSSINLTCSFHGHFVTDIWFQLCRFSEDGMLLSYDSRGIVRGLSSCYGRSSWTPLLDTSKQLGSKSDHYFLVGMTHNPNELRWVITFIVCQLANEVDYNIACTLYNLTWWSSCCLYLAVILLTIIECESVRWLVGWLG